MLITLNQVIDKELICNGCKHCWHAIGKCTAKPAYHKFGKYKWNTYTALNCVVLNNKKYILRDKECCTGYVSSNNTTYSQHKAVNINKFNKGSR